MRARGDASSPQSVSSIASCFKLQINQLHRRAEVVNGLWNALNSRGLASSVGILADESSSLGNAANEYSTWLPQVIDKVAALVHHTYDFPSDSSYTSYVTNTNRQFPGKPTWMSVRLGYLPLSLDFSDGKFRKFAALLEMRTALVRVGLADMIQRRSISITYCPGPSLVHTESRML